MKNFSSVLTVFYILPFSYTADSPPFIFGLFTVIYLLGVLLNLLILTVIYVDKQLHSPMYLFLCNLSLIDLCFTTNIVPKLLHILSSGDHKMSFRQCFTQVFFYFLAAGTEDLLLFTMAYDRYVAICKPLHYHSILSNKICTVCIVSIWFCATVNSFLLTVPAMKMSFCRSTTIHHIYCDPKALTKISCAGRELLYSVMYIELFFLGLFPFSCSFLSYAKILQVILHIKSGEGRKKAFSTCSSHLTVIMFYYTSAMLEYIWPSSKYSNTLDQIYALLFATVTPVVNPLVYSLKNKDVRTAAMRLLRLKYNS